jgi:hypothetical protein
MGRSRSSTGDGGRLPTFLVIGAQKSATRWLVESLGSHPDVYAAELELEYFNRPARLRDWGPDGYASRFAAAGDRPVVGESCPSYMAWTSRPDEVADRIQQLLPEVRLLAILRNPVDRAQSALLHHIRRGRFPQRTSLLEAVGDQPPEDDPTGLISNGWYDDCLAPFDAVFGNQLLVLLHDDVVADPAGVHRAAAAHIGTDPAFVPPRVDRMAHSNELGLWSRVVQRRSVRHRPHAQSLTPDDRVEIYDRWYRDEVESLEERLDRDLSAWDPTIAIAR